MSQNLFNENEALTSCGEIIGIAFRDIIRNYLMEQSNKFSTIELEAVCVSELHCLMAEIRLLKTIENKSKVEFNSVRTKIEEKRNSFIIQ